MSDSKKLRYSCDDCQDEAQLGYQISLCTDAMEFHLDKICEGSIQHYIEGFLMALNYHIKENCKDKERFKEWEKQIERDRNRLIEIYAVDSFDE